jgi:hypothetical protein
MFTFLNHNLYCILNFKKKERIYKEKYNTRKRQRMSEGRVQEWSQTGVIEVGWREDG